MAINKEKQIISKLHIDDLLIQNEELKKQIQKSNSSNSRMAKSSQNYRIKNQPLERQQESISCQNSFMKKNKDKSDETSHYHQQMLNIAEIMNILSKFKIKQQLKTRQVDINKPIRQINRRPGFIKCYNISKKHASSRQLRNQQRQTNKNSPSQSTFNIVKEQISNTKIQEQNHIQEQKQKQISITKAKDEQNIFIKPLESQRQLTFFQRCQQLRLKYLNDIFKKI